MNFKKLFASISAILVCLTVVAMTLTCVFAYSTNDDPLITLSYLNEVVIPALKQEFSLLIDTDNARDDNSQSDKVSDNTDESQNKEPVEIDLTGIGTYDLLELIEGQKVLVNSAVENNCTPRK